MIDALESVGKLIERFESQHEQLGTEFTGGQVSGVKTAYAAIARLIQEQGVQPTEDIPFTVPPQNMTKYGQDQPSLGVNDMVEMLRMQQSQGGNQALDELQEIKGLLNDIYTLMQAKENNRSEEAEKLFKQEQQAQILDDVANEAQEMGFYAAKDEEAHQELDTSFGERLQGKPRLSVVEDQAQIDHDILDSVVPNVDQKAHERIAQLRNEAPAPFGSVERLAQIEREQSRRLPGFEDAVSDPNDAYEETFDAETGARGRQRRIGMRLNVEDDEPRQPVEDWQQRKSAGPHVYMAPPMDNDLQDLGPGDE